MKRSTLFLTGLSLVAAATTLTAQNTPAGARRGGPPDSTRPGPPANRPQLALALDANGDRMVSFDELKAAPDLLRKLDANQDGQITRDELRPARPGTVGAGYRANRPRRIQEPQPEAPAGATPAPRRPLAPLLAAVDTNQDGVLSAEEIAAAPQSLRALDADADQQLSLDEIRPADRRRGFRGPRQGRLGEGAMGPGRGRGPHGPRPPMTPPAANLDSSI